MTEQRRIFVVPLGAWNHGLGYGGWVDTDEGEELLWHGIRKILEGSPMPNEEEWMIVDVEGFGGVRINEYESPDTIAELDELVEDHGSLPVAYAISRGVKPDGVEEYIQDHYRGWMPSDQSEVDWAWEKLEEDGGMANLPYWMGEGIVWTAVEAWMENMQSIGAFELVRDGGDGSTHIFEQAV
jgi:antirestriction protein